ncbi:MAG: exosortase-associated EpsI family protein [Verrucomicrobia bacterium]|nr:exosortase-associated EpsI family protein [Verrucomicrobiota bacterium]
MKQIILIAVAVCLLVVLSLRLYFTFVPPPEPSLTEPLAEILPEALSGWQIEEHDMADSPEASARISDFLNFDDAIFRSYRRGDTTVGVYVAYWKPGKASYRWAGAHTPDTCWVVNGWKRLDRKYSIPFKHQDQEFEPAEFGIYEKNGNAQQVHFWHLVGGQAHAYKQTKVPNIFGALLDIKKYGLNLRQEQIFVRLSTNENINTLRQKAGFDDILNALLSIGMEKKEFAR